MTDDTTIPDDLPNRAAGVYSTLADATEPLTKHDLADAVDLSPSTIQDYIQDVRRATKGLCMTDDYGYYLADVVSDPEQGSDALGLEAVEQGDDPDPTDLTDRERYIATELQTGAALDELAADLDTRESVIAQHLRDLKRAGWQVYHDDTADMVTIESDRTLRSSEHKGTRTRKANRWWELRHNALVREYKGLDAPTAEGDTHAGNEDWVLHLTDLHAGDRVRTEDGAVVYGIDTVSRIVDYITERSIHLADVHGMMYDTAHICIGGDILTNSGVYSGMFEDLDAWLDEQHTESMEALLRLIKSHAERFPRVNIVCQVGNHGKSRASGTSRQANADLILYKSIRNVLSQLQEHGVAENVTMQIGEASPYKNFKLRGGKVNGHLRHGQNRKPQAVTAAGSRDWARTLNDHKFDLSLMGHHHISGRIPWDGPPVVVSGSPKPPSDFVDRVYGRIQSDPREHTREIATCLGVADHGVTSTYPVKTHKFEYVDGGAE